MATPTGITDTTTTSVIIAGTGTITIKKSAVFLRPCFREQLADLDLPRASQDREPGEPDDKSSFGLLRLLITEVDHLARLQAGF